MTRRLTALTTVIIITVLILDQIIKFLIKTRFYLGEDMEIFPWFHLLFVENNGMAFGMTIGSKLVLTLFRLVVVSLLCVYLYKVCRIPRISTGYVVCLSFIIAGAVGNIIDCLFYGVLFNNPWPPQTAQFLPAGGGYAPLCMGKVVDMFFFPLVSWTWPSWMPGVGGESFLFFQPVFNLADAAISCGIIVMILFYHKYILSPAALRAALDPADHDKTDSND